MTWPEEAASKPGRKEPGHWWILGLSAPFVLLILGGFGIVWHWQASSAELLATARLQFVHADGTPVAGVGARVHWTTLRGLRSFHSADDLAPSGADGVVDLGKLSGQWAIGATFTIDVDLLGFDQENVVLAPLTVLTLPPVGRTILRLVDGKGEPYGRPLPRQGATLLDRGSGSDRRLVEYGPDGSADFGLVACGSKLSVLARVDALWARPVGFVSTAGPHGRNRSTDLLELVIPGPDAPGSVCEIVCVVPDDAPRLRVVVLDADGKPRQGDFVLALRYGGVNLSAFTVTTDAMGRFEFLLGTAPERDGELDLRAGRKSALGVRAAVSSDGNLDAGIVRL